MKNHQRSIHTMFGELAIGMRQIVRRQKLKKEVVGDLAGLLAHLFTTYVERRCKNHQCMIHAMCGQLVEGTVRIIATHDLDDEVVSHIADILAHLFTTYVELPREDQVPLCRSAHPSAAELLAWLGYPGTDLDDAEDAVSTAAVREGQVLN
jgi:energy-converting hydrogenase Eha subunit A